MSKLFDYGNEMVPPSDEVAWHEVQEELRATDWRQRASNYFRESETGFGRNMNAAIGALGIAAHQERAQKSQAAELRYLENIFQLEHLGPDD